MDKKVCDLYPHCPNKDDCPDFHPQHACSEFPKCSTGVGKICNKKHPMCKDGKECIVKACIFYHPKSRQCKYFPACQNARDCPFMHPDIPCKKFPKCFDAECNYRHPMCKYDAQCERPDCVYTHTTPRSQPEQPLPRQPGLPLPRQPLPRPAPGFPGEPRLPPHLAVREPLPIDEFGPPLAVRRPLPPGARPPIDPMRRPMIDPMERRMIADAVRGAAHALEEPMLAHPYPAAPPGRGGRIMPPMRPAGPVPPVRPATMGLASRALELAEKDPKDTKCPLFPNCHLYDDCMYFHPQIECKTFPKCVDFCNLRHPLCKFDENCEKPNCKFSHTEDELYRAWKTGNPVRAPLITKIKEKCRFYPKCENANCPYEHPEEAAKGKSGPAVGKAVSTDGKLNCPQGENCPNMKNYAHILRYNHWKVGQKGQMAGMRGRPYTAPPARGRGVMNGARYPAASPYTDAYPDAYGNGTAAMHGGFPNRFGSSAGASSYLDLAEDTYNADAWFRGSAAGPAGYGKVRSPPRGAMRGRPSPYGRQARGRPALPEWY